MYVIRCTSEFFLYYYYYSKNWIDSIDSIIQNINNEGMKNRKQMTCCETRYRKYIFKDTEQTRLNRITEVYEESIEESTRRKRKREEKGNVEGEGDRDW